MFIESAPGLINVDWFRLNITSSRLLLIFVSQRRDLTDSYLLSREDEKINFSQKQFSSLFIVTGSFINDATFLEGWG